jgi:hypothetical protein
LWTKYQKQKLLLTTSTKKGKATAAAKKRKMANIEVQDGATSSKKSGTTRGKKMAGASGN